LLSFKLIYLKNNILKQTTMSPRENINSNNKQNEEAKRAAAEKKIADRLAGFDAKVGEKFSYKNLFENSKI